MMDSAPSWISEGPRQIFWDSEISVVAIALACLATTTTRSAVPAVVLERPVVDPRVAELLAAAPPLTEERWNRLAALFRAGTVTS